MTGFGRGYCRFPQQLVSYSQNIITNGRFFDVLASGIQFDAHHLKAIAGHGEATRKRAAHLTSVPFIHNQIQ